MIVEVEAAADRDLRARRQYDLDFGALLCAYGLYSEIISWKLRLFVPNDASGPAILARVMDRYPVVRVGEREAA